MVTTNAIAKKEEKERQKIKFKKPKGISHCRQSNNPWLPNILENVPHLIKISLNQESCSIHVCSSGKLKSHHHLLLNQLALTTSTRLRFLQREILIDLQTAFSSSLAKQFKHFIVDGGGHTWVSPPLSIGHASRGLNRYSSSCQRSYYCCNSFIPELCHNCKSGSSCWHAQFHRVLHYPHTAANTISA